MHHVEGNPFHGVYPAFVATIERLLQESVTADPEASTRSYAAVRPLLRGRRLGAALARIVAGNAPVANAGERLFITGAFDEADAACCEATLGAHAQWLNVARPLVLVDVTQDGTPAHTLQEFDGVSLIAIDRGQIKVQRVVAHEFAHCLAMADHRVLDEGWAEWLVACVFDGGLTEEDLHKQASAAPPLSALLARRWRGQPCFESFGPQAEAVRARSTLWVDELAARLGIPGLIALMRRIREDDREDVRPLIEEIVGRLDSAAQPLPHRFTAPGPAAIESVRRAFALGQCEKAITLLPRFEEAATARPDSFELAAAYLMLLSLAGSEPHATAARQRLGQELDVFARRYADTPTAFALCIAREGIAIRFAPDFLGLHTHFGRGRALKEAALQRFPHDFDVLIAAAKFELLTPLEFGGRPRAACDLLRRAAAAAPWPEVAGLLARRAQQIDRDPAQA